MYLFFLLLFFFFSVFFSLCSVFHSIQPSLTFALHPFVSTFCFYYYLYEHAVHTSRVAVSTSSLAVALAILDSSLSRSSNRVHTRSSN